MKDKCRRHKQERLVDASQVKPAGSLRRTDSVPRIAWQRKAKAKGDWPKRKEDATNHNQAVRELRQSEIRDRRIRGADGSTVSNISVCRPIM